MRLFFRIVLPVLAAAALRAAPNSYVGSEVCRQCHSGEYEKFYKNPHYKSVAWGKSKPENTGCEGCHGPGQAHVDAFGGAATIVAFSTLKPAQTIDACLRCHAESLSRANIRRSQHTLNGVACTSCHSIHASPTPRFLLTDTQANLCYKCHNDVRAQFDMPFRHRVNEGVVKCSDCHNPHGASAPTWRASTRPRMMEQATANEEPCLKCHSDKRGPFAYEHPPVRVEGCEMCHYPHGSVNSRMLRRPVVFTMCLECHNGARPFGLHGAGVPSLSSTHNMTDPRFQNCTACHVRIHGSNGSSLFFR